MDAKILIILLGDYGSGKTTFAKWYASRHNAGYLDVDLLAHTNGRFDYPSFLEKTRRVMKPDKRTTFILDGAPDTIAISDKLRADLVCKLVYWCCFTSPEIIHERQKHKQLKYINSELPHSIEDIERVTYFCATLATSKDANAQFIDTGNGQYRQYGCNDWLACYLGYQFLCRQPRDYQDIEIPHHRLIGHSESYKTWERLATIYDFAGKNVIDYGTNFGYFLFKAEDAGARVLRGIDVSESVINIARSIAILRGSKAAFTASDITEYALEQNYDVALCLNVLHHLKNRQAFLDKLFTCANDVLIETPVDISCEIEAAAHQSGFTQVVLLNSHRFNRVILRYSKNNIKIVVAPEYVYSIGHYRKQRVKKVVQTCLGSRHLALVAKAGGYILRKTGLYEVVTRRLK